jgi:hypothetical protein
MSACDSGTAMAAAGKLWWGQVSDWVLWAVSLLLIGVAAESTSLKVLLLAK